MIARPRRRIGTVVRRSRCRAPAWHARGATPAPRHRAGRLRTARGGATTTGNRGGEEAGKPAQDARERHGPNRRVRNEAGGTVRGADGRKPMADLRSADASSDAGEAAGRHRVRTTGRARQRAGSGDSEHEPGAGGGGPAAEVESRTGEAGTTGEGAADEAGRGKTRARETEKGKRGRSRPDYEHRMAKAPEGGELRLKKKPEVMGTAYGKNRVWYANGSHALTTLANEINGKRGGTGPAQWTYQGETLQDRRSKYFDGKEN